jgi:hypothetical protein
VKLLAEDIVYVASELNKRASIQPTKVLDRLESEWQRTARPLISQPSKVTALRYISKEREKLRRDAGTLTMQLLEQNSHRYLYQVSFTAHPKKTPAGPAPAASSSSSSAAASPARGYHQFLTKTRQSPVPGANVAPAPPPSWDPCAGAGPGSSSSSSSAAAAAAARKPPSASRSGPPTQPPPPPPLPPRPQPTAAGPREPNFAKLANFGFETGAGWTRGFDNWHDWTPTHDVVIDSVMLFPILPMDWFTVVAWS